MDKNCEVCSISNIQPRQRVVIKTEKKGNKINGETWGP